ncbi:MAG: hypothetical protein HUK20_14535 [Fibrobacter sp.]|nr:hypothetical protein [Fibrobacter sp.]
MDVAIKLTLVASVVLMGYSLSQFFSSYETACEKLDELKQVLAENQPGGLKINHFNTLMISLLSSGFLVMAYFAGFEYWILEIVFGKFLLTGVISNMDLSLAMRSGCVNRRFFHIGKVDCALNFILGMSICLILVL